MKKNKDLHQLLQVITYTMRQTVRLSQKGQYCITNLKKQKKGKATLPQSLLKLLFTATNPFACVMLENVYSLSKLYKT